jgi:hypothetical protein
MATIRTTGERVKVRDECNALWRDSAIRRDNLLDLTTYLESQGIRGDWNALELDDRK